MKKIFFMMLCAAMLCSCTTVTQNTTSVHGEVRTRMSAYYHSERGKDDVVGDVRTDVSVMRKTETVTAAASVRAMADTAGVARNTQIDNNHEGKRTILSMREAYIEFDASQVLLDDLNVAIGKKIVESVVKFDAVDFNPLARRDQSEPFSSMDNDVQDGVLMASVTLPLTESKNLYGQCIVAGRNNPIVATDPKDRWTRDLPQGVSYGDPHMGTDVNYLCRMFYQRNNGTIVEAAIFHGSAAGVDRVVSKGVSVHPVFPEETGGYLAAQMPVGEWVARLGCSMHAQAGADDFGVCSAEVDRIWQFSGGASLFVEVGYINAFTTQKLNSMPTLDVRRALDNHFSTSIEYSPRGGHFYRLRGAYGLQRGDYAFRIEAEYILNQILPTPLKFKKVFEGMSLMIRAEHIGGSGGAGNNFDEHDEDDRIILIMRKLF